jgi:GNAT superfamily N-acetyltransferase
VTDIDIRELKIPAGEGASGWDELVALTELYNELTSEQIGSADLNETPQQVLAQLTDPYSVNHVYGAYAGDELVGFGLVGVEREQTTGWIWMGVAPDRRRAKLGTRLAETITTAAREAGAGTLRTGDFHTDFDGKPRVPAPTGVGSVPSDAPTTQFLQSQGFRLGQVEVMSALELPVPAELLADLSESARPSDDYELVDWINRVPDDLVDAYARLRTIVSTAVPNGDMTEEEEVWDAARVRDREARNDQAGNVTITTAARHRPTGDLVAFTGIAYPAAADGRAVGQGYTMVLPEHRGHNLGIRIKINNLHRLNASPHGAGRIITGNAGENEAMLSINRALGFHPFVLIGHWERKLES